MAAVKKIDRHSMLVRTLSGAVLAALIIAFYLLGTWTWFSLTAAVSCLGLYEFYHLYGIERKPAGILGFLAFIAFYVLTALGRYELYMHLFLVFFLALAAAYVFRFEKTQPEEILAAFFGFFYVPVLLSFLYRVRVMPDGQYLVILIFTGSWICDTFAYFTGVLFGKHKMAPVLSPKKSVEGAIGGVLGAALLGFVYGLIAGAHLTAFSNPAAAFCVISVFAAFVSMVGDLLASAFKRSRGIKDYSQLIPGHGGILDRFDSIITVAPVIFLIAGLFVG